MRPFFSYYGSKWRCALKYPAPIHRTLIEPFAGSAGYALRYPHLDVRLFDLSPVICGVWDFLINASESELMALPMIRDGESIRDLPIPMEAQWLIGFWAQQASTHPGRKASKWGSRSNHGWRPAARMRIARQVSGIRHWKIDQRNYADVDDCCATWFIDSPYNNAAGRKYYSSSWSTPIDFEHLSGFCRSRSGQVIVCENAGADWLPFRHLGRFHAATKPDGRTHSAEVMWTNSASKQLELPGFGE